MTRERRGFLRDNAFLVAAVALPALVAVFFVIANAIPQWTVADPAYDLVLRAARSYDATPATVTVTYVVRDGLVEAVVRPALPNDHTPPPALFLFEHDTMRVREIPLELPAIVPEGETRIVPVDALAGRPVIGDREAPDGYRVETGTRGGPGLVGDIFGMGRYRSRLSLVKNGRVIPIELPPPDETPYAAEVSMIGWVGNDRR
jgi:hypothetical protein